MSMYAEDHQYAHSRLVETIVRLGKEPIWVYQVMPGMMVKYAQLADFDEIKTVHIDKLDLTPVPLGYCNYNKYACYLSRMPMRRDWRQGLRRGNFVSLSGVDANRIPYEALRQVIVGDFPKFDAAVKAVEKVSSMAWHRHWAVDKGSNIFHKGAANPVGKVVGGEIILESRSMYLSEALKEAL